MEASETVMATDLYGKPISIGSTVRYITTRTTGKVIDVKREDNRTWALLDSSKLYYDTHYLEVADSLASTEDEETAREDIEDIEKRIRDMEDAMKIKEINVDHVCEGGG